MKNWCARALAFANVICATRCLFTTTTTPLLPYCILYQTFHFIYNIFRIFFFRMKSQFESPMRDISCRQQRNYCVYSSSPKSNSLQLCSIASVFPFWFYCGLNFSESQTHSDLAPQISHTGIKSRTRSYAEVFGNSSETFRSSSGEIGGAQIGLIFFEIFKSLILFILFHVILSVTMRTLVARVALFFRCRHPKSYFVFCFRRHRLRHRLWSILVCSARAAFGDCCNLMCFKLRIDRTSRDPSINSSCFGASIGT